VPVYWLLSSDPTGTTALTLTVCLMGLMTFYLWHTSRHMDPRPEDRTDAEIADGAGELGFFSPHSWWPFYCGLALLICVLGVVFGWWLFIIGVGVGAITLSGFIFEYYRGEHAH
jgi:hypothetical protein